mgnify:CR=1 FL=1
MKKTYRGSCHCRRVTFEVALDLSAGTSKCNCTFCWKRRWWGAKAAPEDFTLLTGADALRRYPESPSTMPRGFCASCGVAAFTTGEAADWNDGAYVAIQVACLDDLPPEELIRAPVTFLDGRSDAWGTPDETRHL